MKKELKTLKDLEEGKYMYKGLVQIRHLREEAIKDIKLIQLKIDWIEYRCEFTRRLRTPKPKEPEPDLPFESWGLMSLVKIQDYIKWKFNITKEDFIK